VTGRCCYVDAKRRRPLLAGRERVGLLDARAKRCAGADRRDDGWAGCSADGTTGRRGTGRPGRLSRALAMASEQHIERRGVGEREEEGELTSAARTTTATTGLGNHCRSPSGSGSRCHRLGNHRHYSGSRNLRHRASRSWSCDHRLGVHRRARSGAIAVVARGVANESGWSVKN
jgi:hypothetical protein